VGWAAVTGDLSLVPLVLFGIIFLWTPPHFWALALMIKDDYAEVEIPMMPVVKGEKATAEQIWLYTLLTVPFSLLLVYPLSGCGPIYGVIALVLGVVFLQKAWEVKQNPFDKDLARGLFKYSILYMMLLCTGMVIDSLPIAHQLVATIGDNLNSVISCTSIAR
jgi:protoheme IX farnesyltransferase